MADFLMPVWTEFATSIAHGYADCGERANAALAVGDRREATAFRRLAVRHKRLMDKYGITIRA